MDRIDLTLQVSADSLLEEFFDNMPSVPIVLGEPNEFNENDELALYDRESKTIRVAPNWSGYDAAFRMTDDLVHELTHAWVDLMGLWTDFAEGHNEWFFWKTKQVAKDTLDSFVGFYPETSPIVEKIKLGWTPGEPDPVDDLEKPLLKPVIEIPPTEPAFDPEPHRQTFKPSVHTVYNPQTYLKDLLSSEHLFFGVALIIVFGAVIFFAVYLERSKKPDPEDILKERAAVLQVVVDDSVRITLANKLTAFQKANNRIPSVEEFTQIVDEALKQPRSEVKPQSPSGRFTETERRLLGKDKMK
jgi:hypothetical protein